MPSPKGSKWYSTPERKRNRPSIMLTLSRECHEKLEEVAAEAGLSRSQIVEALVLGYEFSARDWR